jgi:prepilin-type N-terminal cleavage/methylation domain-containing protein
MKKPSRSLKGLFLKPGFTLIEIIIVVGIIALIAAIAFPSYLRGIIASREATAASNLKSIAAICQMYATQFEAYPAQFDEALIPYIGAKFVTAIETGSEIEGYYYSYAVLDEGEDFSINADPQSGQSGIKHFYIDNSMVIRFSEEDPATKDDPPL